MKTIVIAMIQLLMGCCYASNTNFERYKDILDADLYRRAEAVIRAQVLSPGIGSKYLWTDVKNLSTIKAPKGVVIPAKLQIAFESSGIGLPLGFATLYLARYNPDHPEYGWRLLEDYDPNTKSYLKGYSHHSKDVLK